MFDLEAGHADTDFSIPRRGARKRFRFHREVEHYLMSGAASFSGGLRRGAKMGKDGERQAIRQGKQLARGLEACPEIVNNDGGVKDATDLPEVPARDLLPRVG
jgi:hypothetical protein